MFHCINKHFLCAWPWAAGNRFSILRHYCYHLWKNPLKVFFVPVCNVLLIYCTLSTFLTHGKLLYKLCNGHLKIRRDKKVSSTYMGKYTNAQIIYSMLKWYKNNKIRKISKGHTFCNISRAENKIFGNFVFRFFSLHRRLKLMFKEAHDIFNSWKFWSRIF